MMRQSKVRILAECAMMLALSIALSFVVLYEMPWGGAVTLLSMLPVMLVSIRHGLKWGLTTSFLYAWFQALQGKAFSLGGVSPWFLIASLLLDYLVAFTVLGLAGAFRRFGRSGCLCGIVLAATLRFASHFLSGVFLWANFEEFVVFGASFYNRPVLYSLLYNLAYMLPETLLTVAGAVALFFVPQAKRLIVQGSDLRLDK